MIAAVVGLGNIGPRYLKTRHNLGFLVVEHLLTRLPVRQSGTDPTYRWSSCRIGRQDILLACPTTYMNRSGKAARDVCATLGAEPSQLLVVVDDFALPLGALRIRTGGSDGGHNGLASIVEELASENFPRLRLGIGPVPDNQDVVDFVLGEFTEAERPKAEHMIIAAAAAVEKAVRDGVDAAMSAYNRNPAPLSDSDGGAV